ncbi:MULTISPECIES: hypothetical protein [unclassified Nocardiopsis]|uniref:hypothetical protein n=1 Tax=Nocardiopsis TaxID=2013 RepID=UPI00387B0A32
MPRTAATDLTPGTTYTVGDPTDPNNTVTVTARPYTTTLHSRFGTTRTVLRIPVTLADGTRTHDTVNPDTTVNTN